MVASLYVDPIEKKSLFHYRPGQECLSVGGLGCNMRCLHCQNHALSFPDHRVRATYVPPDELVGICRREGLDTIAFTYNEPAIWLEYVRDTARESGPAGIAMVTNGMVSEEPLREACGFVDAMNIDVKGFTEGFYRRICGAGLDDVLRTCEIAFQNGIHTELTYLLIPGINDSREEVDAFCAWVMDSLSPDVPVHFSAFHPDHLLAGIPPTPASTVLDRRTRAMDGGCGTSTRATYGPRERRTPCAPNAEGPSSGERGSPRTCRGSTARHAPDAGRPGPRAPIRENGSPSNVTARKAAAMGTRNGTSGVTSTVSTPAASSSLRTSSAPWIAGLQLTTHPPTTIWTGASRTGSTMPIGLMYDLTEVQPLR